jgi:hypothetical protein
MTFNRSRLKRTSTQLSEAPAYNTVDITCGHGGQANNVALLQNNIRLMFVQMFTIFSISVWSSAFLRLAALAAASLVVALIRPCLKRLFVYFLH